MQIKIPIRALSVNKSSKGKHFKSPEYKKFERDVTLLLPFNKEKPLEGELFVKYTFYFLNYTNSDTDNGVKLLQDILVARGYLKDDRYIKAEYAEKIKVDDIKDERILLEIVCYNDRYKIL